MFRDEALFHMNGHVNRNNVCIWGQKLPYEVYGHVQDFLKVNVWCGMVHGAENTIMANIYLDMLHLFLFPQIAGIEQEKGGEILFQQDGAAPHFRHEVQSSLNISFANPWIRRGGPIMWST